MSEIRTPTKPGAAYKIADGSWCSVISTEGGDTGTDALSGRGMAVIYGPTREVCVQRAEACYEALKRLVDEVRHDRGGWRDESLHGGIYQPEAGYVESACRTA